MRLYQPSKELPAPSLRDHDSDIQMANLRKSQHRKDKKKAPRKEPNESSQEDSSEEAPRCYSCGKKGHMAVKLLKDLFVSCFSRFPDDVVPASLEVFLSLVEVGIVTP
jgi:hypothetical protein